MRYWLLTLALVASSCGESVTAPTPRVETPAAGATAFSINGTVYDTVLRALPGVEVEIRSGPHTGQIARTNDRGEFAFDQPFTGSVIVRAAATGYREQSKTITTTTVRTFFNLESNAAPARLSGAYDLTFTADPACTMLPVWARRRSYHVETTPTGPSHYLFTIARYGSSTPGSYSDILYVNVFENVARVWFSDPSIFEHAADDTHVEIYGDALGSIAELPAALTSWARVSFCPDDHRGTYPHCAVPRITCESTTHQLTISRR